MVWHRPIWVKSINGMQVYEKHFYTVNENLALEFLFRLVKKYVLKVNMKVVKDVVLYMQQGKLSKKRTICSSDPYVDAVFLC